MTTTSTYIELDLDILADEWSGLLTLLFAAASDQPQGLFDQLIQESSRYAIAIRSRFRDRIYDTIVGGIAQALFEARGRRSVSVVIPAYNASATIKETLASVFAQTYAPAEIIVVNDGSLDDTFAAARLMDVAETKIKIITIPNGGVSNARNVGVQAATSEYVALLDADDLWEPTKLAIQMQRLQEFYPAFSHTDYRKFDEGGVWGGKTELERRPTFQRVAGGTTGHDFVIISIVGGKPVQYSSDISPSSVVIRREDYLAAGGFNPALAIAEDFEFFMRLYARVPAVVILQPLTLYRQHARQVTTNAATMKFKLLDVITMMLANPTAYPRADMEYFRNTLFEQYFIVGLAYARYGNFAAAVTSLQTSLMHKWTLKAQVVLVGALICQSSLGRATYNWVRATWLKRPWKR